MRAILILAGFCLAGPAAAQTVPRVTPAPWWMANAVFPTLGQVRTEVITNRASFSVRFTAVGATPSEATDAATAKASLLTGAWPIAEDKMRVQTNVQITPLYEQYTDKAGRRVTNQRADAILRYQANVTLAVSLRDLSLLEKTYFMAVAAKPDSLSQVDFDLELDNAARAQLQRDAFANAGERARSAAAATGAKLGPIRLIDPTGAACQADLLLGPRQAQTRSTMPQSDMEDASAIPTSALQQVEVLKVGGSSTYGRDAVSGVVNFRTSVTANPPLDLPSLTLQPPMARVWTAACVIYALN